MLEIRFVLVRPRTGTNIGAVVRICKNMGCPPPYIVAPAWFERNHLIQEEIKRLSWRASDLIPKIKYFRELESALRGFDLILTTSACLKGMESLTPYGTKRRISRIKANKIAVLFGSENSGLSKKEASFGAWNMRIPTVKEYPDLNISHAAAIIAYELCTIKAAKKEMSPLKNKSAVFFLPDIEEILRSSSFLRENNGYLLNEIRLFLARLRATKREAILLRGILRKVRASLKR